MIFKIILDNLLGCLISKKSIVGLLLLLACTEFAYTKNTVYRFKKGDEAVEFFETPTRYIIIDSSACNGDLECIGHVVYYEINKKTGKALKIGKGSTLNIGNSRSFKGYNVVGPDKKSYMLILQYDAGFFTIYNNHTIESEELRKYYSNYKGLSIRQ